MNVKIKRVVCAGSVGMVFAIGIIASYVKKKKISGKYGDVQSIKKRNRKRGK